MGMRIGGAGNAWASQQSTAINNWQQRQQNFKSLKSALQTGDLTAAQQAFAAISAGNPNATSNANSPLAQIGQALQAGNMSGAQSVAQNWQHSHMQDQGVQQSAGSAAAAQTFLQTLSVSMAPSASSAPPAQATPAANTTTSAEQVTQALMAFEKNLFDALQAQSPQAPNAPSRESHHHHGGQGGGQMASELSSLIGQTSQATGTEAASPTTGLDQSFKSLLSTLGVSGNNASLNSFLQSMSDTMQASSTTGA